MVVTGTAWRCTVRLADFIVENREAIVREWEAFAQSLLLPTGGAMSPSASRDHADEILSAIVHDMNSFQTDDQQAEKSKGHAGRGHLGGAGRVHAVTRMEKGFRLSQVVAEYRALRASVLRLWNQADGAADLEGVTRFNESIDEALTVSTSRYMETMERYRDQFLAILGHDLRNPVGAIVMGASTLVDTPETDERTDRIAHRILSSAKRMDRMVCDLLDLTRTRLGAGIPIHRAPMDLDPLLRQVMGELKDSHPNDPLGFAAKGDLRGEWDSDRLAQVVSNLVGNAVQHGSKSGPVTLVARDEGDEVVLEVHNEGPPISTDVMGTLFEPMIHGSDKEPTSTSLGLGLYIADQVVTAHGGNIDVTSTMVEGTTFVVHLPRLADLLSAGF